MQSPQVLFGHAAAVAGVWHERDRYQASSLSDSRLRDMTTDSNLALWATFHSAKDALLRSIESFLPSTQHILLTPAAKRDLARTSLQDEPKRGELDLLEIRSVQERLIDTARRIAKRNEKAQTLLSPCAGMPVEILQQILFRALKPEDPRAILKRLQSAASGGLSSPKNLVCSRTRTGIGGQSG